MYKSMFYVEKLEWKRRVVYRGMKLFFQVERKYNYQQIILLLFLLRVFVSLAFPSEDYEQGLLLK